MCPNQIIVYSFRMEKLEKLCLLLISENASSPPGQKLVVGKNPILPLFDIANSALANKHPQKHGGEIISIRVNQEEVTGNNIYAMSSKTHSSNFSKCVLTRSWCTASGWRIWKNCARSLFRRMHRAHPDKNLLLAKTQFCLCSISRILHLQVNILK